MNMKTLMTVSLLSLIAISCNAHGNHHSAQAANIASGYTFVDGYPTAATVRKAYDEADLNRAIQCYRFFYPTVSILAVWDGNMKAGCVPNQKFAIMDGAPAQVAFTPNSDTRYAGLPLDLTDGPVVIEVPAGPIMSAVNDMNQLWVMDIGMPGPDKGKGGKHIILPPNYTGKIPEGYYVGKSTTNHILVLLRAIPLDNNPETGEKLMRSIKVYPLGQPASELGWVKLNDKPANFTPVPFEQGIGYWERLARFINEEPANPEYRTWYGELAELGIEKGKPFNPDTRLKSILEKAAVSGNAIMRVQAFADRRETRIVWKDRQWEWAVLRYADGKFDTENYVDLYAREKWFYQAQIESPAMFNRAPGAGSLYWLGLKDKAGAYLDGSKTYKLNVPLPVPGKLFWSITIYDNETRSEIAAEQNKAALRSLFELKDKTGLSVDLYFGPKAPTGKEDVWIQTLPGKGWFSYFRIYGPEDAAFDGAWRPGDFEEVQ